MTMVFRSENYPSPYNSDTECIYRIKRANSLVCKVEIYFSDFTVGSENSGCSRDYLLVNNRRYCGYRRGEKVMVDLDQRQEKLDLLFKTDQSDNFGGFRLDIRQISDQCDSNYLPSETSGCKNTMFTGSMFRVYSPGLETSKYGNNLDCNYKIVKSSFEVCALEVEFNILDIEESPLCYKDYLEINNVKVCGKIPLNDKSK